MQIFYRDQAGHRARLAHHGRQGPDCLFNQTFQQLVYAVFYEPVLREQFRASPFNTDYLKWDGDSPIDLDRWLVRVPRKNHPMINMLTVVEFVISLRGLPVENEDIPAIWDVEYN
ncbi:hypothetical protein PILCRDRAFT_17557 [Piloderma croceum F 1598]|uniref:Uncharacterized protein n=1 Tax=Piloderma croceum (strain F 1598) TaxID=765440 RepID=A0A0C3B130_PILCF|nr:hypothetical protein PILCRDRAFT_17557 [Piloderma croceum F 1598]